LLASTVHGQPRERDIDAIPGSPPTCVASRRDAVLRHAALGGSPIAAEQCPSLGLSRPAGWPRALR